MKQGYRFVDCDMHIMEPTGPVRQISRPGIQAPRHLLDAAQRRRPDRHARPAAVVFDGTPTSNDGNISQYNRTRGPLVSQPRQHQCDVRGRARLRRRGAGHGHGDGRDRHRRAVPDRRPVVPGAGQYGPAILGGDLPGLQRLAARFRPAQPGPAEDGGDAAGARRQPRLPGAAIAASRNTARSAPLCGPITSTAATGTRITGTRSTACCRTSNVPLCFHEGTGSYYSTIEPRFGENRFMRHVASHSTEMQLALIALMLGGIFEFYPRLRVAFLEAQSWWVPGLLGRIEWDLRQHHDCRRALSEAVAVRILAAQLLLGDRERRARGRRHRRAAGRRRQHLRVERLPAFRLELSRRLDPGADQSQHHPRDRRQDPQRRRPPLRLHRRRFRQGRQPPRGAATTSRRHGRSRSIPSFPAQAGIQSREALSRTALDIDMKISRVKQMAWNGYTVIDMDAHIRERADKFFKDYIDPEYRGAVQPLCEAIARQEKKGDRYALFGSTHRDHRADRGRTARSACATPSACPRAPRWSTAASPFRPAARTRCRRSARRSTGTSRRGSRTWTAPMSTSTCCSRRTCRAIARCATSVSRTRSTAPITAGSSISARRRRSG